MDSFVTDLLNYFNSIPAWGAYGMLFIASYLENVFPPFPGDVCIIFAGYLASVATLSLPVVVAVATLSGILGFMTVYYLGRTIGIRLTGSRYFRWIDQSALDKVEQWVARWGVGVILLNRFLAALRSVVAFSIGMGRMKVGPVILCSSIAALVWTTLLATSGLLMGENWDKVWRFLIDYSRVVLAVVILLIVGTIWRKLRARKAGAK